MVLLEILKEKQEEILSTWIQQIIDSYPADTARFMKREKDRFNNPVGFTLKNECPIILNELLGDLEFGKIRDSLDKIIKIRAVQEFSPSEALDFLFRLKQVIVSNIAAEISNTRNFKQYLELDARLEKLFSVAFDLYSSTKERIAEVRINEMKQRTAILLKRADQIFGGSEDFPETESEDQEPNN